MENFKIFDLLSLGTGDFSSDGTGEKFNSSNESVLSKWLGDSIAVIPTFFVASIALKPIYYISTTAANSERSLVSFILLAMTENSLVVELSCKLLSVKICFCAFD